MQPLRVANQGKKPRLAREPARAPALHAAGRANLASPDAAHLTELVVDPGARDRLEKIETYSERGQPSASALRFTRPAPAPR